MKFNHWLFAIIIAISIHISLAFAYVLFNSDSKEITIVELSGEKVSVNLSSYILASDVVSKPVKPIVALESVPKAKPKTQAKTIAKPVVPTKVQPVNKSSIAIQQVKPVKKEIVDKKATAELKEAVKTENVRPSNNEKSSVLQQQSPTQKNAQASSQNTTTSSSLATKKAVSRYTDQIAQKIYRNKIYPRISRKRHEQGIVKIEVTIDKKGNVIKTSLTKSSGFKRLDTAALKSIAKSSPFPPFLDTMNSSTYTIIIPISYSMQ